MTDEKKLTKPQWEMLAILSDGEWRAGSMSYAPHRALLRMGLTEKMAARFGGDRFRITDEGRAMLAAREARK